MFKGDPNIRIKINGEDLGKFSDYNYGMELEAGLYQIEFYREGYESISRAVTLKRGYRKSLSIRLKKNLTKLIPKENSTTPAKEEPIRLAVASSRYPLQIKIEKMGSGENPKLYTLTKKDNTLALAPGRYRVEISYQGQVIRKTFSITDTSTDITLERNLNRGLEFMFLHRLQEFIKIKVWVLLCAVTLLHPSINVNSKTFASTYASTYKLYRKGQFKKSLTYGSKALKRAKSRAEKAKILKVMGISSYMLGKKKLSMTYFRPSS